MVHLVAEREHCGLVGSDQASIDSRAAVGIVEREDQGLVELNGIHINPVGSSDRGVALYQGC